MLLQKIIYVRRCCALYLFFAHDWAYAKTNIKVKNPLVNNVDQSYSDRLVFIENIFVGSVG